MATSNYNNFQNTQTFDATLASPTGLINSPAPTATNPKPTIATPQASTTATPAAASTYTGAQANAANWGVTDDQTVQGQVKKIIAEDSPLSQMAETRSLQEMNKRGLVNSSMAVQSGQAALYGAALPIAQQDASTYARSGEFNAGAQQQVGLSNQSSTNQANSQNSQLQTNVNLNNSAAANDMSKFRDSLNTDIAKFNASESNALKKLGMDSQTKMELANIEASYKTLMQSQASASDLYKQMVLNTSTIMTNKDMDAATKSTAIKNQIALLNSGLSMIGQIGNLNLSGLLTFDVPGTDGSNSYSAPVVSAPAPVYGPAPAPVYGPSPFSTEGIMGYYGS
jgi:hypothetical protein